MNHYCIICGNLVDPANDPHCLDDPEYPCCDFCAHKLWEQQQADYRADDPRVGQAAEINQGRY